MYIITVYLASTSPKNARHPAQLDIDDLSRVLFIGKLLVFTLTESQCKLRS